MPENYLFAVTMINNNNTDNIILTKKRKKETGKAFYSIKCEQRNGNSKKRHYLAIIRCANRRKVI